MNIITKYFSETYPEIKTDELKVFNDFLKRKSMIIVDIDRDNLGAKYLYEHLHKYVSPYYYDFEELNPIRLKLGKSLEQSVRFMENTQKRADSSLIALLARIIPSEIMKSYENELDEYGDVKIIILEYLQIF